MDAAEPTGPEEADPERGAVAVSVPPTVVAPTARWTAQGREVARPELPRLRGEAPELVGREADNEPTVEDADRGRHRSGGTHGRLARKPHFDSRRGPGSHGRRASSRARRRRAPLRRGLVDLLRDVDQVVHRRGRLTGFGVGSRGVTGYPADAVARCPEGA